jgi:hypothetical protein
MTHHNQTKELTTLFLRSRPHYLRGSGFFYGWSWPPNYGYVTWYVGPQTKISSLRSEKCRSSVVFIPGSLCGWSLGQFLWCHRLDLLCLISKLHLMGDQKGLRCRLHRLTNYNWSDLSCGTLPLLGELIRCHSDRDDYVRSCGGVAMSDSDRTDSITQVPTARRAWTPVVTSRLIWY